MKAFLHVAYLNLFRYCHCSVPGMPNLWQTYQKRVRERRFPGTCTKLGASLHFQLQIKSLQGEQHRNIHRSAARYRL